MVQLNVTSKNRRGKVFRPLPLLLLLSFILTGCSSRVSGIFGDRLIPNTSDEQLLLLDPTLVTSTFVGAENLPYDPDWVAEANPNMGTVIFPVTQTTGTPDHTVDRGYTTPTTPGRTTTDTPTFESPRGGFVDEGEATSPTATPSTEAPGTPKDYVPMATYAQYLRDKIVPVLDEAIGSNANLYYRVFAMGPDIKKTKGTTVFSDEETETVTLVMGGTVDYGNYSSFKKNNYIVGEKATELALKYFGQLSSNAKTVDTAIEKALRDFSNNNVPASYYPDDIPENHAFRKTDTWKMWHVGKYSNMTASAFQQLLDDCTFDDCIGVLPEFKLSYVKSGSTGIDGVHVNDTSCSKIITGGEDQYYMERQPVNNVNALFTHRQQFTNHLMPEHLDYSEVTDGELLKVYIDGYYTVIIYVGAIANGEEDTTIEEALEDATDPGAFEAVSLVMDEVLMPYEFAAVMGAGYSFDVIPAGTK